MHSCARVASVDGKSRVLTRAFLVAHIGCSTMSTWEPALVIR